MFMPPVNGARKNAITAINPIAKKADTSKISSFFSVPIFNMTGYMTADVMTDRVSP